MKTLLFIGHAYHKKTKSSRFMIEILQKEFQITEFYYDPYADDTSLYNELQDTSFDVLVCWQILPPRHVLSENISFKTGVFFPMYDAGPRKDSPLWVEYRDFLIINFSKAMHMDCLSLGLSSRYIQYFPEPVDVQDWGDKDSVFFWNRVASINLDTVASLLSKTSVKHLHLHKSLDPTQEFKELTAPWNITISESTWYDEKKDMLADIDRSALYIAPRPTEGIGMSFLEAMARGRCVIAPDLPTMNEYIENGVTGILYDLKNPNAISLEHIEIIQKNTAEYIRSGYQQWEEKEGSIVSEIESYAPPSPLPLPVLYEKKAERFFIRFAKSRILSHIGSTKSKKRYKEKVAAMRAKMLYAKRATIYVLGISLVERVTFANMESWNIFATYPLFTRATVSGKSTYSILGIRIPDWIIKK